MKFTEESLKLYAITDRKWLNGRSLSSAVEDAIKGGVTFVQLREKDTEYNELKKIALEVKKVTDKYNIPFVINDNVRLCMEIDADGVHLGADDMPVREARKLLGNEKIIGGTARTLERAVLASEEGADYIGIGAVFATSTKEGTTHMTKDLASKINNTVSIPSVAIGGINKENIHLLKGYGIKGVAIVSAIFSSKNITNTCKELKTLCESILQ